MLIAQDDSGYTPGYDVRDRQGMRWSVKLGIEAKIQEGLTLADVPRRR
jgi:hypothetical protein